MFNSKLFEKLFKNPKYLLVFSILSLNHIPVHIFPSTPFNYPSFFYYLKDFLVSNEQDNNYLLPNPYFLLSTNFPSYQLPSTMNNKPKLIKP